MKHTPRTWMLVERCRLRAAEPKWEISDPTDSFWIAQVWNEDDARLIAAAPDLLEALKWHAEDGMCACEGREKRFESVGGKCGYCRTSAAIAKAEGRE